MVGRRPNNRDRLVCVSGVVEDTLALSCRPRRHFPMRPRFYALIERACRPGHYAATGVNMGRDVWARTRPWACACITQSRTRIGMRARRCPMSFPNRTFCVLFAIRRLCKHMALFTSPTVGRPPPMASIKVMSEIRPFCAMRCYSFFFFSILIISSPGSMSGCDT